MLVEIKSYSVPATSREISRCDQIKDKDTKNQIGCCNQSLRVNNYGRMPKRI